MESNFVTGLNSPAALACNTSSGDVYIGLRTEGAVVKAASTGGNFTYVAGASGFSNISGLAVIGSDLFVADNGNGAIYRLSADGVKSTLASLPQAWALVVVGEQQLFASCFTTGRVVCVDTTSGALTDILTGDIKTTGLAFNATNLFVGTTGVRGRSTRNFDM